MKNILKTAAVGLAFLFAQQAHAQTERNTDGPEWGFLNQLKVKKHAWFQQRKTLVSEDKSYLQVWWKDLNHNGKIDVFQGEVQKFVYAPSNREIVYEIIHDKNGQAIAQRVKEIGPKKFRPVNPLNPFGTLTGM